MAKKTKKIRNSDPFLNREKENYQNPIPSRELILEVMNDHGVPIPKKELIKKLEITKDEYPFFEKRIGAMARQGQILINRKDILCISKKLNLIPGKIMGHPDGFGFLIPEDSSLQDVFISPKEMSKVFHNDEVMVQVTGLDKKGRQEGVIVEVLSRGNSIIVGRVIQNHGVTIVRAEDKRISQDILVPYHQDMNAQPGQVVEVEMTTQPDFRTKPMGQITKIIGNYSDSGIEIEIALRKHHLPYEFSKDAIKESESFKDEILISEYKDHADLTKLDFVTIDGETAKDFDDAVFAEKAESNMRLFVAIADVSSYVSINSQLDKEALSRGNSVYFPRRVIPMLPEKLSNGLCSLNPQVNRLTMVCEMVIDNEGLVSEFKFYPAIIFSKARLTYTIAHKILYENDDDLTKKYSHVLTNLKSLKKVYDLLSKQREKRSAIEFDSVETAINFNEDGKIDSIQPVHRNEAHKIIEECMLAANVSAAKFLLKENSPAIYRNHESPKEEKLELLKNYIAEFGLKLGGGQKPSAKDYSALLQSIRSRPESQMLQTMILRSMQQAVYETKNKGHFGLAYDTYTHFTSPIRRYPDLIVHRAIKEKLKRNELRVKDLDGIAKQCSTTERRADEASRDVEDWLKCYFMKDRLGDVFSGTISSVTGFGVFVSLDEIYIEGLIHVTDLGNDYYVFNKSKHALIGERSGKSFGMGDRVKIKVAKIDMELSRIDLILIDSNKLTKNKNAK
ncbi:MAG: ribonuclease R [Methylophilaceae bacterium]